MTELPIILSYAPPPQRAGLAALLDLDAALGGILRSTREPLVGQMRLVWWRDALAALDRQDPPAEPKLVALGTAVLPIGVTGAQLAGLVDGWEELLADPLDEAALIQHAQARGAGLFAAAATVLGGGDGHSDTMSRAGEGWALADVARNLSSETLAVRARELAQERLSEGLARRWPRSLRALGALALLARMDLSGAPRPVGHPARVGRLLRFRLTGR